MPNIEKYILDLAAMTRIRRQFFKRVRKVHGKQKVCGCSSLIFDGHGRWINSIKWKPFSQGKLRSEEMLLSGLADDLSVTIL